MAQTPQVWHYGLVARWWAEFNTDGPEIAYFKALIEQYGQPALDVACGTGRLLIPVPRLLSWPQGRWGTPLALRLLFITSFRLPFEHDSHILRGAPNRA